jgi:hypothetical protein
LRRKLSKILSVELSSRHDERIEALRQIAGDLPYHERYMSGERVGVWADLFALASELRYDPLAIDALAVAYETMHRAANNIEILVPRLEAIGYKFRKDAFSPYWKTSLADAATREVLEGRLEEFAEAARAVGHPEGMPPNLVEWCERSLCSTEASVRAARERRMGFVRPHMPPETTVDFRINRIVRLAGEMPLSLRAWYQTVGAVNLVGTHPELAPPGVECDPLFVAPLQFVQDFGLAWNEDHAGDDEPPPFQLPISPHRIAKTSGSTNISFYTVSLPNMGMDAVIENEPHGRRFVEYLRVCFEWGGFPGYADCAQPAPSVLASLKEGLEPL